MTNFFAKTTKPGVPISIMILQGGIVTISALLTPFTSGDDVDSAFTVSSAATTAQYLMVYMIMLIAYIVLKRKHEDYHRMYYMSKNANRSIAIAVVALIITVVAFFVTFVPAEGTPKNLAHIYVWTLIGMCAIVSVLPLIIYRWHEKWQNQSIE